MKKMGRIHRPFFRICAIDKRAPRDGRALEELGTYDPSIADTHARVTLNNERIKYWLSVGAQPSEKCAVLIKKYGEGGTHLEAHKAALQKLAMGKEVIDPGAPPKAPEPEPEAPKEEAKAEGSEGDAPAADAAAGDAAAEAPAEAAKAEQPPAEEKPTEENSEEKSE